MILLTQETQWKGGPSVVAFGMFDGVHLGHASLMNKAVELGKQYGLPSIVYTFSNHPMAVFAPEREPLQIYTRSEKIRTIAEMGITAAILRPFDREYAARSPEEFVRTFCDALHPKHVVIGFNYTFGCKGAGKAEDMERFGKQYGFETHIMPEVQIGGEPVSSTRTRAALLVGNMELAAELLGREYTISGTVCRGKQLGSKLGFPTANLSWPQKKILPPNGVYAAKAYVNGKWYTAALNVGRHPTAPEGPASLEANLINYDGGEFYGASMRLVIYSMIRPERKFDSLESLKEEVLRNKEQIRRYFETGKTE